MKLEEKARSVYKFFGEESQELKKLEEYHELQEALHGMTVIEIKEKLGAWIKESVAWKQQVEKCNEKLADYIFVMMQLDDDSFEYNYRFLIETSYNKKLLYINYDIENFTFDKEEVRRVCEEKCERTLKRYNIKVEV